MQFGRAKGVRGEQHLAERRELKRFGHDRAGPGPDVVECEAHVQVHVRIGLGEGACLPVEG